MSKSLDNYVGLNDEPGDMYGKLMNISDELMWRYYDLLSFKSNADFAALKASVRLMDQCHQRCKGGSGKRIDSTLS